MKTFLELSIKQELKDSIANMGFTQPTPIQAEIIPHILEGKDCLAQAPTGTGKTCAFGVPIVNMVDTSNPLVQAVILCPTRELAMQTETELKKLATLSQGVRILAVYGGQPIERQLAGLRKKPQIIVGTPGRVIDHLRRRTLKLHGTKMFVLDEADEMLNMGFKDDIDAILQQMPGRVQSLLFSATMPREILDISKAYQTDPVSVKTTIEGGDMPPIVQYYVKLKDSTKYEALKRIIKEEDFKFVLVFTNTKRKAGELDEMLNADGLISASLHGDLRQRVRDTVMRDYRNKKTNILVATDVAARGIDVDDIEAIFNYDVPLDEEYYIHRIGRTARANRTGIAYSFVTTRDIHKLNFYEKLTGSPIKEYKIEGLSEDKLNKSRRKADTGKKFFLNVGAKDELTENKMTKYIISNTNIKSDDIEEIKILDIFSFVTIRNEVADELLTLKGNRFANRRLAVETSEELPRGGSGSGAKRGGRSQERSASQGGRNQGYSSSNRSQSSDRNAQSGRSQSSDRRQSSDGNYSSDRKKSSDGNYSTERKSAPSRSGERSSYAGSGARGQSGERQPYVSNINENRSSDSQDTRGERSQTTDRPKVRSIESYAAKSPKPRENRARDGQNAKPYNRDSQSARPNQYAKSNETHALQNAEGYAPVWEKGAIDVDNDRRTKNTAVRNERDSEMGEQLPRRRNASGEFKQDNASSGERSERSAPRRPSGASYRVAKSEDRNGDGERRQTRSSSSASGERRPSSGGSSYRKDGSTPRSFSSSTNRSSTSERSESTRSGENRKPSSTSGYSRDGGTTERKSDGSGSSYKGERSSKPAYGKAKSYKSKPSASGTSAYQKFKNGAPSKKRAPVTFGDSPSKGRNRKDS